MDTITPKTTDTLPSALERLHRAAVLVAGAHDIDEALQAIVDSSRELVNAQFAAIGVPGEPGKPMARFFVSGVSRHLIEEIGAPPTGHGVLGQLLDSGKTIRIKSLPEHQSFHGFPSHHPKMTSFLGIPIQIGGQVLGDLYLGNKIGAPEFSSEDQQLIDLMAAHAAVIIQNLNYQEHARQLTLLREREEIARQLQDDVLQAMYGSGLLLNTLDLNDQEKAFGQLHEAQIYLDRAVENLRNHLLSLGRKESASA